MHYLQNLKKEVDSRITAILINYKKLVYSGVF